MVNQTLKFRNPEKLIIILFLSLILFYCSAVYSKEANKSTITVTVAGLKTDDGEVKITVYNNEEWNKTIVFNSVAKILDKKCEITIENMPYGDFAIFVYQDKNANGKLDKINEKFPTEPFGYSRVKQMVMGPVRWNDIKFSIESPKIEMEVLVLEIPPAFLVSMKNKKE